MLVHLELLLLFHGAVIKSRLGVFLNTKLSKVFESSTHHIELIALPLVKRFSHKEVSVLLPSAEVLPFFKGSSSANVIESTKSSGQNGSSLLFVSSIKSLVSSDLLFMLLC